jgi:hypothetical protein
VPRSKPAAGWKVALIASAALAAAFVIFGGLNNGFSKRTIITLALAGALLGAIAVPDFQPESFRHPALWQVSFAILGCSLVAFHFDAGPMGYAMAVVIGAVLGYCARFWTKYIDVP